MNGLFIDPVRLPMGQFVIDYKKIEENFPQEPKTKEVLILECPSNSLLEFWATIRNQISEHSLEDLRNMKIDLNDWFKKLESHYGTVNILGEYLPGKRKINYYPMDSNLEEVVKIHERFHAIHHLTTDSRNNNEIWTNFSTKSPLYIELLAELFTYRFCKDQESNDPRLLHTFLDLSDRQHFVYQTWQIFKNYNWPQIIELYWAIRNGLKIQFLENLQKKFSSMSSTPNPNSKNAPKNSPSQAPQIMPTMTPNSSAVIASSVDLKKIDSAVFDGIRKTINRFREKPFHYFTEADIHSSLLNDIMSGSSDVLAIRPPNLDKISISLVHQEYPTNFRYKKSEILNAMFDEQTMKDTCLENENHYGDRGNFDLVVLNPEFILSIIDEANVLESLQHIINKDIHFAKERKSSNQNDHDTEILYAIEVKFIHIFNARKIHMLYEIIKDNNKLKYAQKHSRNKIRAVNLIFCSTNDNKLRGNKDSVINIIKEFFDKGEIEIQENVLQMRAEMPEEILSIFIESHIYNVDDKSIKVTSKPIFNKKHPVWAEDLIKLLKLEY